MSKSEIAAPKRTLFVSGLDPQVDEQGLHAAFIPFGDIVDVTLPRDGASSDAHRGFGFVEFEEGVDAAAAMENMQGGELFGRVLKVSFSTVPTDVSKGQALWASPEWMEKHGENSAAHNSDNVEATQTEGPISV